MINIEIQSQIDELSTTHMPVGGSELLGIDGAPTLIVDDRV